MDQFQGTQSKELVEKICGESEPGVHKKQLQFLNSLLTANLEPLLDEVFNPNRVNVDLKSINVETPVSRKQVIHQFNDGLSAPSLRENSSEQESATDMGGTPKLR